MLHFHLHREKMLPVLILTSRSLHYAEHRTSMVESSAVGVQSIAYQMRRFTVFI